VTYENQSFCAKFPNSENPHTRHNTHRLNVLISDFLNGEEDMSNKCDVCKEFCPRNSKCSNW